MIKIFYEAPIAETIEIIGDDFEHLKVLRVKTGDILEISNNSDKNFTGEIFSITKKGIIIKITGENPFSHEPKNKATLFQAILKGEKNETIIQKCTELGISRIVFFSAERSITRIDETKKKHLRFQKIARMAAMQSNRDIIPDIEFYNETQEILEALKSKENKALFHEKSELLLSENITEKDFFFAIGPEGGFSESEAQRAVEMRIPLLSLGNRILRAETAPLCVMSCFLYKNREI